jgi:hypothetical protein
MVDIINNLIGNKKQLDKVLRLLCLVSVTQGGIEKYNLVKQDILNVYGYQKLFLMKNLEKMGLLKEKVVEMWKQNIFTYNYDKIKSDLKLLNTDFNGRIFEDCAYVLTGLCPITLRLVESAVKD